MKEDIFTSSISILEIIVIDGHDGIGISERRMYS